MIVDELSAQRLRRDVRQLLPELDPQVAAFARARFGLDGLPRTLVETALHLGIAENVARSVDDAVMARVAQLRHDRDRPPHR